MAFGWSFPKLMVVITVAFFLFATPLITFAMILWDRHKKKKGYRDE